MGMLAVHGLIYVAVINIVIYGIALWFGFRAFRCFAKQKVLSGVLAGAVFMLPFLYYGYTVYIVSAEFGDRQIEVESWARKPVPKDRVIKSVKLVGHGNSLQRLIYSGVVDTVTYDGRVYEWGDHCVKKSAKNVDIDVSGAQKAQGAYLFCSEPMGDRNDVRPPIWLYLGQYAPSRRSICSGHLSFATAELRWSPDEGGELIAFDELTYFRRVAGPIFWFTDGNVFRIPCKRDRRPNPKYPDRSLDIVGMVRTALNLNDVQISRRQVSPEAVLRVLKMLNKPGADVSDNAIILLLGNQRSTPEISDYIRSSLRKKELVQAVLSRLSSKKRRDRMWVNVLDSHAPDFLAICDVLDDHEKQCPEWSKKLIDAKHY